MATPVPQIVPRGSKAKGTDICGQESWQYVIRSDLGYYMLSYHIRDVKNMEICPLHPTCSWGDHYVGVGSGTKCFYIIKGNSCRCVSSLETDEDSTTFTLRSECVGGDFYMATYDDKFYVIRGSKLVLVEDMKNGASGTVTKKDMHRNCTGGLYYWATRGFFYFIKPSASVWGFEYHRTRDLTTDSEPTDFTVDPTVAKFLPGGLAVTMGRIFGEWQRLKTIDNEDNSAPLNYRETITKKVGYNKEVVHSVEHNWKLTAKAETQLFQTQFSLETSYGGSVMDTTKEAWSEQYEITEDITGTVAPGKVLYIWQYKICMQKEGKPAYNVLFTPYVKITDTVNVPTVVPRN